MSTVEFLKNGNVKVTIPISLRSCAGRKRIIAPDVIDLPTDPVVQNIVRAFRWQQMIDAGEYANVTDLANALGRDFAYVARTIRLALLCPDIVHAALNGTLPQEVSLGKLYDAIVDDWNVQKKIVGME